MYIFETDGDYVNFNGGGNLWRIHKNSQCIAWHWDETGDLFFDVYDQQYVVKAENIATVTIGGVTLSTAADFETNIKLVFPGLAGGLSYLVYAATANSPAQQGDIPDFTIMQNTIGNIVWSVISTGNYKGTLAGAFPVGKVLFFPGGNAQGVTWGIASALPFEYGYNLDSSNADEVYLSIYKTSDFSGVDLFDIGSGGTGKGLPFKIEVYP